MLFEESEQTASARDSLPELGLLDVGVWVGVWAGRPFKMLVALRTLVDPLTAYVLFQFDGAGVSRLSRLSKVLWSYKTR